MQSVVRILLFTMLLVGAFAAPGRAKVFSFGETSPGDGDWIHQAEMTQRLSSPREGDAHLLIHDDETSELHAVFGLGGATYRKYDAQTFEATSPQTVLKAKRIAPLEMDHSRRSIYAMIESDRKEIVRFDIDSGKILGRFGLQNEAGPYDYVPWVGISPETGKGYFFELLPSFNADHDRLVEFDLETMERLREIPVPNALLDELRGFSPEIGPSGQFIYFPMSVFFQLIRLDLINESTTVVAPNINAVSQFTFSPDGKFLYTIGLSGEAVKLNLETKEVVAELTIHERFVSSHAILDERQNRLLIASWGLFSDGGKVEEMGILTEVNTDDFTIERQINDIDPKPSSLAFDKNNEHLFIASASIPARFSRIDMSTFETEETGTLEAKSFDVRAEATADNLAWLARREGDLDYLKQNGAPTQLETYDLGTSITAMRQIRSEETLDRVKSIKLEEESGYLWLFRDGHVASFSQGEGGEIAVINPGNQTNESVRLAGENLDPSYAFFHKVVREPGTANVYTVVGGSTYSPNFPLREMTHLARFRRNVQDGLIEIDAKQYTGLDGSAHDYQDVSFDFDHDIAIVLTYGTEENVHIFRLGVDGPVIENSLFIENAQSAHIDPESLQVFISTGGDSNDRVRIFRLDPEQYTLTESSSHELSGNGVSFFPDQEQRILYVIGSEKYVTAIDLDSSTPTVLPHLQVDGIEGSSAKKNKAGHGIWMQIDDGVALLQVNDARTALTIEQRILYASGTHQVLQQRPDRNELTVQSDWQLANWRLGARPGIHGYNLSVSRETSVESVRYYSHAAEGELRLLIYSAEGEQPLLWDSGTFTNDVENEMGEVAISSGTPNSLTLSPGEYHLAWQSVDPVAIGRIKAGDDGFYASTGSVVPEMLDGLYLEPRGERWAIYLTTSRSAIGLGEIVDIILGNEPATGTEDINADDAIDSGDAVFWE